MGYNYGGGGGTTEPGKYGLQLLGGGGPWEWVNIWGGGGWNKFIIREGYLPENTLFLRKLFENFEFPA